MIKPTKKQAKPASPFVGQSYQYDDSDAPDDFVSDVVRLAATVVPMSTDQKKQLSRLIISGWGGDRPYIARREGEGRSQRNDAIKRDYLRGEHFELLERRYGLTRRRLMQIVKI